MLPLANYWPAEEYHQDFFEKNPHQGYCVAVAAPKVAKFRKTFADLAAGERQFLRSARLANTARP